MAATMFSLFILITCSFLSTVLSSPPPLSTQLIAVDRQISPEVFNCKGKDATLNVLCNIILGTVNNELSRAGVAINQNAILVKYDNQDHQKIDTGHSCSTRAHIRRRTLTAAISRKTKLSVTFPSLHTPIAVALKLPVVLNGEIVARQRYGSKIFGKCHRIGRDTFTLRGRLSTTADTAIAFTLQPKMRVLPSGDISVTIRPEAAIIFHMKNTNLKLRISGQSPLSSIWTFVNGVVGSAFKSVDLLFNGKSFKTTIQRVVKGAGFDFGSTVVLTAGNTLFKLLGGFAPRFIKKQANKIVDDLENDLNRRIKSALKARPDGTREFIIGNDFRKLIAASGAKASVIRAPKKKVMRKAPAKNRCDSRCQCRNRCLRLSPGQSRIPHMVRTSVRRVAEGCFQRC